VDVVRVGSGRVVRGMTGGHSASSGGESSGGEEGGVPRGGCVGGGGGGGGGGVKSVRGEESSDVATAALRARCSRVVE
jgi:hypothetical protein